MKPKIAIGWILASKLTDTTLAERYDEAGEKLLDYLQTQFPAFDWQLERTERRAFPAAGVLKPLPLLELGAEEKLHQQWDFCVVIVPNDLEPRQRISTLGIPSSALEVAVLSSARLGPVDALSERLAALALHLLGHLFTLEHAEEGPMRPPNEVGRLTLEPFPKEQLEIARDALRDVADARLEETHRPLEHRHLLLSRLFQRSEFDRAERLGLLTLEDTALLRAFDRYCYCFAPLFAAHRRVVGGGDEFTARVAPHGVGRGDCGLELVHLLRAKFRTVRPRPRTRLERTARAEPHRLVRHALRRDDFTLARPLYTAVDRLLRATSQRRRGLVGLRTC